ncbi:hypothetical protein [Shewanella morhuae]|uniref:Uncharacterized protein n=1 Tax=Shewanella morhuae TaxID=365591 RepID=A0A380A8T4_9GAMM|nr:hypothetical protein [Shewanella morhuae]SUI76039.1 Uncharacterised protein [Shewanella morhuae]
MNKLVYIVGGGTFAIKLAKVLIDNSINFEFVDELSARTLLGRNVYKAIDVPNVMAYFIIAISHPQYANNAIDRLCDVGVIRSNILPLIYESAANVLEHMLNVDKFRFWRLLDENDGNFLSLEKKFFVENYNDLKHNSSNKKNIGFYYIGKGGGFRGHVLNLPLLLNENFEVKEFSDQPAHLHNIESYNVMSEHAMLDNSWPDIVINPHFFECSPSNLPKLTMMHMVYDFLVYKDLVARVMGQPETHYLFIPSKPSMMLHQNICKQYKLKNNIV